MSAKRTIRGSIENLAGNLGSVLLALIDPPEDHQSARLARAEYRAGYRDGMAEASRSSVDEVIRVRIARDANRALFGYDQGLMDSLADSRL